MDQAIDVNPDVVSLDALRERAWQIVQPMYLERLGRLVESFGEAVSNGRGSDLLDSIGAAAVEGRIETLLIEADRLIPGRVDPANGSIDTADLQDPAIDDVLDDLGELGLCSGGDVVIVPAERMPTGTGAAAIHRY